MDFLIENGLVFHPAARQMERRDIAICGGVIARPQPGRKYRQRIDASGCIVTPGLIDYHVHYYFRGAENSVNPDASSFCCGVTTAVDAGTCGAGNFELFRRSVIPMSETRIFSLLMAASGGLSNDRYPENLDPAFFDEEKILGLFARCPETLVGLKTRLSKGILSPQMARDSLKRTVEIARKAKTRVVVHVTDCPIPLDEVAAMLDSGDVICHIFHGKGEHTCLGSDGRVLPGLWEARRRGVVFDACNGCSNYDLEVCRAALDQMFFPDVISSDMNASGRFLQPLHSLPRILSKYLDMGMELSRVLEAATLAPARLIGRPELASMDEGTPADVAVFQLRQKPAAYTDANGHTFQGTQVLVPMMTFQGGSCVYCQADFC